MSLQRSLPNFQHLFRQLEDSVSSIIPRVQHSMLSPTVTAEAGWMVGMPSADVHETDKSYVIEAELPGVKKENVSMELVDENTIRLTGNYSTVSEEKGKTFWTRERYSGEFRRGFTFPTKIDPDKIKASMENGLLKVEIEKAGEEQKKIPLQIE